MPSSELDYTEFDDLHQAPAAIDLDLESWITGSKTENCKAVFCDAPTGLAP